MSASRLSVPRLPGLYNGNGICAGYLRCWADRPSASLLLKEMRAQI